ncbi:MAG: CcdB family protein [Hyphomicrobiaceae bacterium]
MRQFDICRLRPVPDAGGGTQLVVILQADLVSELDTRVVAPLVAEAELPALLRLRPEIHHNGRRNRLIADRLSVLSVKSIGSRVGSCADRDYDIRRALDIVFVGV